MSRLILCGVAAVGLLAGGCSAIRPAQLASTEGYLIVGDTFNDYTVLWCPPQVDPAALKPCGVVWEAPRDEARVPPKRSK